MSATDSAVTAEEKKVRVCYIAGREESYSRTRMILHGLRRAGYDVVTCLPPDRSFKHYPKLLWDFIRKQRGCDLVVVGFYGQILFPFVWLLTRKPILYDVYISTYDTMIHDRGKGGSGGFKAKLFWWSDAISMRLANRIILETVDHIRDYATKFRVRESKFFHIFLATDEKVVARRQQKESNGKFLVHFHGEYAPFHGVQYILKAAAALSDQNVHFQIIGRGITYERDMRLAQDLKLKNCTFIDWVPFEELSDYMARADCCLGIFGDNPRTLRVLTNKVIESIAAGKPLITAKNEPVQELLADSESALLVERGNPQAIAEAILKLRDDPELRKRVAEQGHLVFLKNCTLDTFAKRLNTVIEEMLN